MVLTQLEGKVAAGKWDALKQVFHGASQQLPPPILLTYLLQDGTEKDTWRIISVWRSRQALEEYRSSVETPGGVLMFRSVGVEPTLTVFDVVEHAPEH